MNQYFVSLGPEHFLLLLEGAVQTIWLGIWAILFATLVGLLIGWIRYTSTVGEWALAPIVDVARSVPLLIQIILVNSGLGVFGIFWGPFQAGLLVLSVYSGAYMSEVFRSGLMAVPAPTRKAGTALGMNAAQVFIHVTSPIAWRIAFPGWINIVLGTLKDTSLVAAIGYIELLRASQIVITQTQEALPVLCGAGAIYFVMCYVISFVTHRIEARS